MAQISKKVEPTAEYPNNTHPGNQPDEYVKCPYFPEHELRRSRLPYHLRKCQNNPRAPDLVACPFNYMHRIRPEDKHDHAILCEDRVFKKYSDREAPSAGKTREMLLRINGSSSQQQLQQQPAANQTTADGDEEWW